MTRIGEIIETQLTWQALSADALEIPGVALESLRKCNDALAALIQNLQGIGYVWASTKRVAPWEVDGNVQMIEASTGLSIPRILVEFWKLVGGVSLVDLENYRHTDFWSRRGIRSRFGFADGLHIDMCDDEWTAFTCDDYQDWKEFSKPGGQGEFLLSLSPDGFHKDNISGGDSYGVMSGSEWKPAWCNFEWSGAVTPVTALSRPADFLSYLRTTILECAGFPALLGVPGYEPIREELLRGVPLF